MTVNIANRLAQALTLYVKRDGVATEAVVAPYGFYGPVAREDILPHTAAMASAGYVSLQEVPPAPEAAAN